MFHSKRYQVKAGDNLTNIAIEFGLPSWRYIYDSSENARWKAMRGSPDNVHTGDVLMIPPNPILILEYKLQRFQKINGECEQMYDKMLYEANRNYRDIKGYGSNIDAAATLAQLGFGLAKLVKSGYSTMKLAGKELAEANSKLAKSVLIDKSKSAVEQIVSVTPLNATTTGEEGLALAATKIIVKSWFDMTSPSYWVQRYTGVNIEQTHAQTTRDIMEKKKEALEKIDAKIKSIRGKILELRSTNNFESQLY